MDPTTEENKAAPQHPAKSFMQAVELFKDGNNDNDAYNAFKYLYKNGSGSSIAFLRHLSKHSEKEDLVSDFIPEAIEKLSDSFFEPCLCYRKYKEEKFLNQKALNTLSSNVSRFLKDGNPYAFKLFKKLAIEDEAFFQKLKKMLSKGSKESKGKPSSVQTIKGNKTPQEIFFEELTAQYLKPKAHNFSTSPFPEWNMLDPDSLCSLQDSQSQLYGLGSFLEQIEKYPNSSPGYFALQLANYKLKKPNLNYSKTQETLWAHIAIENGYKEGFPLLANYFMKQMIEAEPKEMEAKKKLYGLACYYASNCPPSDTEEYRNRKSFLLGSVKWDIKTYITYIRRLADQGNAQDQFNLAEIYDDGWNTAKNPKLAIEYYTLSAKQGFVKAQLNLGLKYQIGQDVPQDYSLANHYFKLAADQGDAKAQSLFAENLALNRGVPQDFELAVKYTKLAAEQGYLDAQKNLASFYATGHGVSQDPEFVIQYIQTAADKGDALARYNLAILLAKEGASEEDLKSAFVYLKLAADQGHVAAQDTLALRYYYGIGTSQSRELAIKYAKLAAEKGWTNANYTLAVLYNENKEINKIPSKKVKKHLKLAAKGGNAEALLALKKIEILEQEIPEELSDTIEIAFPSLEEEIKISDDESEESKSLEEKPILIPVDSQKNPSKETVERITPSVPSKVAQKVLPQPEEDTKNNPEIQASQELKNELMEYQQEIAKQNSDFRQKKILQTLKVTKADYCKEISLKMNKPLLIKEQKIIVSQKTLDFVNSIYGVGKIKINNFKSIEAQQAFAELGCQVENKKGHNTTLLSFKLKDDREMNLSYEETEKEEKPDQEKSDQPSIERKGAFHNPHGKDNLMYDALKPYLKRFLESIGRTLDKLDVRT